MQKEEESKRLFLGIALNEEWIDYINSFIQLNTELKIKWIPEDNWHFTVLFMGSVPLNIIFLLEIKLQEVFSQNIGFYIDFEKFIYAPSARKARMIWAKGMKNRDFDIICKESLSTVEKLFKDKNLPFNMSLHKENIPHVTLSRLKTFGKNNYPELNLPEKIPVPLPCSEIILFESRLKPSGSEYCKLAAFKLKETS
jgi:RNA 2',3'-cyclic 3'-phosphodiesterase